MRGNYCNPSSPTPHISHAPLAQLDRALVYGTKGQEFESLTAHQNKE